MATYPAAEALPAAPFVDWVQARLDARRGDEDAVWRLLGELGWADEAGMRRLHHWRFEVQVVNRRALEDALDNAGVGFWEIYPDPDEHDSDEGQEFCWACREFVGVARDDAGQAVCVWCDVPIQRVDLRGLPARPRTLPSPPPPHTVKEQRSLRYVRRRARRARRGALDVDLDLRLVALKRYASTGQALAAGSALIGAGGPWSSPQSAAAAVRVLLDRNGWRDPKALRKALRDGSWQRVTAVEAPSQRRVLTEAQIHEAAWLYFYDELSFAQIAQRLLPIAATDNPKSLKDAVHDEFDRRGWPRRTHRAARRRQRTLPPRRRRCLARTKAGRPCRRWAAAGKRRCPGHDPDRALETAQRATRASRAAHADSVDILPWRWWLRRRVADLGSVRAVHARVADSVSYDTLINWVALRSEKGRDLRVRRSRIDRVLAAWADGTTFEDIYRPCGPDADAGINPLIVAPALRGGALRRLHADLVRTRRPLAQVAQEAGVDAQDLRRALRRADLKLPAGAKRQSLALSDADIEAIARQRARSGQTVAQIAARRGIDDVDALRRALRAARARAPGP